MLCSCVYTWTRTCICNIFWIESTQCQSCQPWAISDPHQLLSKQVEVMCLKVTEDGWGHHFTKALKLSATRTATMHYWNCKASLHVTAMCMTAHRNEIPLAINILCTYGNVLLCPDYWPKQNWKQMHHF